MALRLEGKAAHSEKPKKKKQKKRTTVCLVFIVHVDKPEITPQIVFRDVFLPHASQV